MYKVGLRKKKETPPITTSSTGHVTAATLNAYLVCVWMYVLCKCTDFLIKWALKWPRKLTMLMFLLSRSSCSSHISKTPVIGSQILTLIHRFISSTFSQVSYAHLYRSLSSPLLLISNQFINPAWLDLGKKRSFECKGVTESCCWWVRVHIIMYYYVLYLS